MKKLLKRIGICLVLAASVWCGSLLADRQRLNDGLIRFHVVANSDREEDQAQKLRVRDAVLQTAAQLTADCTTADEARQALMAGLPEIEAAARRVLCAEGSTYSVRVSLQTECFETRRYETFTLPAGEYPSLRVVIGAGAGHNWWCVVFPSLCMAATGEDLERAAAAGGFDDEESALVTGGEEEYVLRFKTLEWLQSFFALFS